jgi:RNA exonuclease 1
VFGYEVRRKGAPHNCLDDACAAMKLVLAKIEHGVDNVIPLVPEDVSLDI